MASEYLKKLAKEQKVEETKHELTPQEKRKNWWDYNKGYVALAVVAVVIVGFMINDLFFSRDPEPDYQIGVIGSTYFPEDTVAALEGAMTQLGEDLNGDGQVLVKVKEYPMYAEESNYQTIMAAQVQLSVDLQDCESLIFLMEDPAAVQNDLEMLAYPDGTAPGAENLADEDIWYAWTDCPVLMGLELGEYTDYTTSGTVVGSNQEVLQSLCIARRTLSEEETGNMEGAIKLWETLIEGAAE